MGDCNAYKISRVVLLIFNILFFAFGLAMLGIGIYARVHSTKYDDYLTVVDQSNSTWENFGSLCIAAGVICSVLGFTGIVGAAKQHKGCMIFFVSLISLIFILEVASAGLAYGYEGTIKSKARDGMFTTLKKFDNNSDTSSTQAWNDIQKDLQCCGVDRPSDWWNNTDYEDGSYPESCRCNTATPCGGTQPGAVFPAGCYTTVVNKIQGNWRQWGGALIAFAVLQLIGILAGIVFIRKVKTSDYYLA